MRTEEKAAASDAAAEATLHETARVQVEAQVIQTVRTAEEAEVVDEIPEEDLRTARTTAEDTPARARVGQEGVEVSPQRVTDVEVVEEAEIVAGALHQNATAMTSHLRGVEVAVEAAANLQLETVQAEPQKRKGMECADLAQDHTHLAGDAQQAQTVETRGIKEVLRQEHKTEQKRMATRIKLALRKPQKMAKATNKSKILRVRMISKSQKKWLMRETESPCSPTK